MNTAVEPEFPAAGDLRKLMRAAPLPFIPSGTIDPTSITAEEANKQAVNVAAEFNDALRTDDPKALEECFFAEQAYWKDSLALTYHLRTFNMPSTITTAFLKLEKLRGIVNGIRIHGEARLLPVAPTLQFIDAQFSFATTSPAAACSGKLFLLPIKTENGVVKWKIWILSTRLENLDVQPEDETLLQAPAKSFAGAKVFETDVFIIGGGNSGATLAARLKALGVDYVMVERNAHVGDNWALRYDGLKFHVPTSFCETPFLCYDGNLAAPRLLTRDDLAEHLIRYVETLKLNVITSASIQSTTYDISQKIWTITFETPDGVQTVKAKHLVQATGVGSQNPCIPTIADEKLYKGLNIHSSQYKSGAELQKQDINSIIIVGSANTAFDILVNSTESGLKSTMIVRSPTYVVPTEYVTDHRSLGVYDFGVDAGDRLLLSLPMNVDASLAKGLFTMLSTSEPDRYKPLEAAGFPVFDSTHPDMSLMHNLVERCGGHYMDNGGTDIIVAGKADVKSGAEPVAFTETGLRLSDESELSADAVIWCTGFNDTDVRNVAEKILGGGKEVISHESETLGPREVADRMDTTWGIDGEGEIRGLWKRHARLDNFWIMGGYTQQHRWHSKTLALQIKADLEGILPPAYRDIP